MRKQQGVGVISIILIVLAVALLGVIAWRVYETSKSNSNGGQASNQASKQGKSSDTTKSTPQFSLASGHVIFTLPEGWTASGKHVNTDCMRTLGSTIACIDQSSVSPDAAGKVDGVPAYSVNAAVYKHENSTTAKQWWENDFGGDNGTTNTGGTILGPSTDSIAGYDAYTFTLDRGNNNGEINYIVATKDYVVLVKAVAEGVTPTTNTPVKNFLPAVKSMVASIKIQ